MDGNQTIEGTINSVVSRKITKKDGSGDVVLYDIDVDGQVYTTKIRPIALEAHNFLSKRAKMQVKIAQNGEFTNYYLQSVIGEVFGQSAPTIPDPFVEQQPTPGFHSDPDPIRATDSTETKIHRQTATKVAAAMFEHGDSLQDFWANVDELIRFYETGEKPMGSSVLPPEPRQDDEIPF